ncbi:MAG: hypothetical protein ACOX64_13530 [Candidatus Merdivicinus sp.]|jgi:hypothetical protein
MEENRKIYLITGHYGSGKTNFAVNLALDQRRQGKTVTLVDLDIVNPYFRSADFSVMLEKAGIKVISPVYANSNLDIPALTGAVDAVFDNGGECVIIDVGGDDAGAIALGRYAPAIARHSYELWYVVNRYRYLTQTPEDALSVLRDIEAVSRLHPTGVINCSNLGQATSGDAVENSADFAAQVAGLAGIPMCYTAYDRRLGALGVPQPYPVTVYVKKLWDEAENL